MEKIFEAFKNLNEKTKFIEEVMLVMPHKHQLGTELSKMSEVSTELKDLHGEMKASLRNHEDVLQSEYRETKESINRVQMKMMFLLNYLEDGNGPIESCKSSHVAAQNLSDLQTTPNVPKITINNKEIAELTPLSVIKKKPIATFNCEITDDDFEKVPAYMKGRVAVADLREFLDSVVIPTFRNKYRIIAQRRSNLKPGEFELQSNFRFEAKLFEGEKFVTAADLARSFDRNLDKKHDRFLQMLRHLQVIREARKNAVCCYIWLKSDSAF